MCVVMALTNEGRSLEDLHEYCHFRVGEHAFTVELLCRLACQGIEILEFVHKSGYIHRDVHPGNFVWKDGVSLNGIEIRTQILK
jgi:serine/threonine protein kinase